MSSAAAVHRLERGHFHKPVVFKTPQAVPRKPQIAGGADASKESGFEEQAKGLMVKLGTGGKVALTKLDDVVGHSKAKEAIRESVVLPALR